jgi:hypothetical protein
MGANEKLKRTQEVVRQLWDWVREFDPDPCETIDGYLTDGYLTGYLTPEYVFTEAEVQEAAREALVADARPVGSHHRMRNGR